MTQTRCRRCNRKLGSGSEDELLFNQCDLCSDIDIDRSEQRARWREYHPGERCPEIELTPYPKRVEDDEP